MHFDSIWIGGKLFFLQMNKYALGRTHYPTRYERSASSKIHCHWGYEMWNWSNSAFSSQSSRFGSSKGSFSNFINSEYPFVLFWHQRDWRLSEFEFWKLIQARNILFQQWSQVQRPRLWILFELVFFPKRKRFELWKNSNILQINQGTISYSSYEFHYQACQYRWVDLIWPHLTGNDLNPN